MKLVFKWLNETYESDSEIVNEASYLNPIGPDQQDQRTLQKRELQAAELRNRQRKVKDDAGQYLLRADDEPDTIISPTSPRSSLSSRSAHLHNLEMDKEKSARAREREKQGSLNFPASEPVTAFDASASDVAPTLEKPIGSFEPQAFTKRAPKLDPRKWSTSDQINPNDAIATLRKYNPDSPEYQEVISKIAEIDVKLKKARSFTTKRGKKFEFSQDHTGQDVFTLPEPEYEGGATEQFEGDPDKPSLNSDFYDEKGFFNAKAKPRFSGGVRKNQADIDAGQTALSGRNQEVADLTETRDSLIAQRDALVIPFLTEKIEAARAHIEDIERKNDQVDDSHLEFILEDEFGKLGFYDYANMTVFLNTSFNSIPNQSVKEKILQLHHGLESYYLDHLRPLHDEFLGEAEKEDDGSLPSDKSAETATGEFADQELNRTGTPGAIVGLSTALSDHLDKSTHLSAQNEFSKKFQPTIAKKMDPQIKLLTQFVTQPNYFALLQNIVKNAEALVETLKTNKNFSTFAEKATETDLLANSRVMDPEVNKAWGTGFKAKLELVWSLLEELPSLDKLSNMAHKDPDSFIDALKGTSWFTELATMFTKYAKDIEVDPNEIAEAAKKINAGRSLRRVDDAIEKGEDLKKVWGSSDFLENMSEADIQLAMGKFLVEQEAYRKAQAEFRTKDARRHKLRAASYIYSHADKIPGAGEKVGPSRLSRAKEGEVGSLFDLLYPVLESFLRDNVSIADDVTEYTSVSDLIVNAYVQAIQSYEPKNGPVKTYITNKLQQAYMKYAHKYVGTNRKLVALRDVPNDTIAEWLTAAAGLVNISQVKRRLGRKNKPEKRSVPDVRGYLNAYKKTLADQGLAPREIKKKIEGLTKDAVIRKINELPDEEKKRFMIDSWEVSQKIYHDTRVQYESSLKGVPFTNPKTVAKSLARLDELYQSNLLSAQSSNGNVDIGSLVDLAQNISNFIKAYGMKIARSQTADPAHSSANDIAAIRTSENPEEVVTRGDTVRSILDIADFVIRDMNLMKHRKKIRDLVFDLMDNNFHAAISWAKQITVKERKAAAKLAKSDPALADEEMAKTKPVTASKQSGGREVADQPTASNQIVAGVSQSALQFVHGILLHISEALLAKHREILASVKNVGNKSVDPRTTARLGVQGKDNISAARKLVSDAITSLVSGIGRGKSADSKLVEELLPLRQKFSGNPKDVSFIEDAIAKLVQRVSQIEEHYITNYQENFAKQSTAIKLNLFVQGSKKAIARAELLKTAIDKLDEAVELLNNPSDNTSNQPQNTVSDDASGNETAYSGAAVNRLTDHFASEVTPDVPLPDGISAYEAHQRVVTAICQSLLGGAQKIQITLRAPKRPGVVGANSTTPVLKTVGNMNDDGIPIDSPTKTSVANLHKLWDAIPNAKRYIDEAVRASPQLAASFKRTGDNDVQQMLLMEMTNLVSQTIFNMQSNKKYKLPVEDLTNVLLGALDGKMKRAFVRAISSEKFGDSYFSHGMMAILYSLARNILNEMGYDTAATSFTRYIESKAKKSTDLDVEAPETNANAKLFVEIDTAIEKRIRKEMERHRKSGQDFQLNRTNSPIYEQVKKALKGIGGEISDDVVNFVGYHILAQDKDDRAKLVELSVKTDPKSNKAREQLEQDIQENDNPQKFRVKIIMKFNEIASKKKIKFDGDSGTWVVTNSEGSRLIPIVPNDPGQQQESFNRELELRIANFWQTLPLFIKVHKFQNTSAEKDISGGAGADDASHAPSVKDMLESGANGTNAPDSLPYSRALKITEEYLIRHTFGEFPPLETQADLPGYQDGMAGRQAKTNQDPWNNTEMAIPGSEPSQVAVPVVSNKKAANELLAANVLLDSIQREIKEEAYKAHQGKGFVDFDKVLAPFKNQISKFSLPMQEKLFMKFFEFDYVYYVILYKIFDNLIDVDEQRVFEQQLQSLQDSGQLEIRFNVQEYLTKALKFSLRDFQQSMKNYTKASIKTEALQDLREYLESESFSKGTSDPTKLAPTAKNFEGPKDTALGNASTGNREEERLAEQIFSSRFKEMGFKSAYDFLQRYLSAGKPGQKAGSIFRDRAKESLHDDHLVEPEAESGDEFAFGNENDKYLDEKGLNDKLAVTKEQWDGLISQLRRLYRAAPVTPHNAAGLRKHLVIACKEIKKIVADTPENQDVLAQAEIILSAQPDEASVSDSMSRIKKVFTVLNNQEFKEVKPKKTTAKPVEKKKTAEKSESPAEPATTPKPKKKTPSKAVAEVGKEKAKPVGPAPKKKQTNDSAERDGTVLYESIWNKIQKNEIKHQTLSSIMLRRDESRFVKLLEGFNAHNDQKITVGNVDFYPTVNENTLWAVTEMIADVDGTKIPVEGEYEFYMIPKQHIYSKENK